MRKLLRFADLHALVEVERIVGGRGFDPTAIAIHLLGHQQLRAGVPLGDVQIAFADLVFVHLEQDAVQIEYLASSQLLQ